MLAAVCRALTGGDSPCTNCGASAAAVVPVAWSLRGEWTVRLMLPSHRQHMHVEVTPPETIDVLRERHQALPLFDNGAAGWLKGARLGALAAQEATTPWLLTPGSVRASNGPDGAEFVAGVDYDVDEVWGTVGRRPGGAICEGQAVELSYSFTPLRLDSIVFTAADTVELRQGAPYSAPHVAQTSLAAGDRRLMNIWLPGRAASAGLTAANVFPVLETCPSSPSPSSPHQLPGAVGRLQRGEPLSIVAWGDSVTDGSYLPSRTHRWQEQFVTELRLRFPASDLKLHSEGWGGRSTSSYLAEPADSSRYFPRCVLARYVEPARACACVL